jgi:hypothetical protein
MATPAKLITTMTDKSVRYGYRYGGTQGVVVNATSSVYLNRMGANFCTMGGGQVAMCASNSTTIGGWATGEKETTINQAVQMGAIGEELFVITDPTAVFEVPVNEAAASLAASQIGEACFVAESGGSTTSYKQYVKIGGSGVSAASALLFIRDVDVDNKTAFVSINPAKFSVT